MGKPIAAHLFYPAAEKRLVQDRFAEIHRARLAILLPIAAAIAVFLLGSDVVKVGEPGVDRRYFWFLYLDIGFLALHLGAWIRFRLAGRVDGRELFLYAFLVLAWAALTAAVEFRMTGNVTTIIIAVMAVAVLLFFSFFVFCALVVSSLGIFLAASFLLPGLFLPSFEQMIFLFALTLVSVGASRALFSAFAENIRATARLVRANQELRSMQLQLIQREKFAAIGQLSAGIAHEINNPLGFLKSNFSTLEQGFQYIRAVAPRPEGDEAGRHFMEGLDRLFADTREGFRRISEVIGNLRSFSHDLPEGVFAPYDLVEGVESTLAIARHRYQDLARIERNLAPVPQVQARGSEINQVLLNLLLNAVTAVGSTESGREGVITVTTGTDGSSVFFEISDTGPGVPEALRTRIFDPFFTTKPVREGFGLGLSLSWEIIVNRHQGSLDLLEGKPATFRVSLPIRRPAATGAGTGVDQVPRLG